jgi:hypothetical protein
MALEKVKGQPLSDGDMRALLGKGLPIMTNRELGSVSDVNQLFDEQGRFLLLYTPQDPTSGHWVCLMKRPDSIYYWDPYGERPDIAADLGGQPPVLTKLLKESGMPIFYNSHQYQSKRGDVATCGRWCAARLHYKDLSEKEFQSVIKKFKGSGDDFVSALAFNFIKK